MRHLLAPTGTAVALALLLGCGSTTSDDTGSAGSEPGSPSASPTAASASSKVGECAADAAAVQDATRLTSTDLDGDGSPDDVRVTAADAAGCPSTVFARVGEGFLVAPRLDGPAVTSASAVRLPGTDADLLVTQQQHPRGGTQTRVYAAADGALAELQDPDGNPVVPFVATDTPPAPVSVTCTDDGIAVTEAVAHEPAGVIFTWDVRRTTYAVTDGRAERTGQEEVADNVLPGQLRGRFPELARAEVLADCRP
ncbi:hypothetical protein ASG49_07640 [Marmoricola sp. Leaf446]|uniref:hypothetical protein n=1 Tax=Marmoricola sp. Leaf446 TaxID=1736379 RepID=UPI0006F5506E|nr:hypothetical protein [Marmoricola sp. Leaf446]KQT94692.1 hypothetical protein ASG49_07640 [Marmoricola sp. Leaf446]